MKTLSIVAPMFNEESLVLEFCSTLMAALDGKCETYDLEILLVNDGSTDGTLDSMRLAQDEYPKNVTIVDLTRNFGLEGAVRAGLLHANGDAVVVMDADLQDPPTVINQMLSEWENGADVVVGSRVGRPNDSLFKRLSARFFYSSLGVLSGRLKLESDAANFRLLSRTAVERLLALPEVNGVFRVLVPFVGMKTAIVGYERDKRFSGKTKYNFGSMIRYALDSITGISIAPLRKVPLLAAISFTLTMSSGAFALLCNTNWQPIAVATALISFQFTLILVAVAVVSEYIGQIYLECKRRPTSIVDKVWRRQVCEESSHD